MVNEDSESYHWCCDGFGVSNGDLNGLWMLLDVGLWSRLMCGITSSALFVWFGGASVGVTKLLKY